MALDARRWKAEQRMPLRRRQGDSIEDYRIEKKLGQGATGGVHKAQAMQGPLAGRTIAIKIIQKGLLNTDKRLSQVDTEIELHRALPIHPAIVRFEHSFEDDTNIYILTEYCPGATLFAHLQNNFPTGLPESQARHIFLSLVQAVSFLHINGVLHRDLKLTNVLLTETLQVKIADFGLATRLDHANTEQEMTMCGTPNYISPEIVKRHPYGFASDIWSLGCMLVTLLTGRPPFQGEHISETLRLVSKGVHRPLPRGASKDVRHLVDSILQVDPSKRLSTAEIMAHPFLASQSALRDLQNASLSDNITTFKHSPMNSNNPFRRMPVTQHVEHHAERSYPYRGQDHVWRPRQTQDYQQRLDVLRRPARSVQDTEPHRGSNTSYTSAEPYRKRTENLWQQEHPHNAPQLPDVRYPDLERHIVGRTEQLNLRDEVTRHVRHRSANDALLYAPPQHGAHDPVRDVPAAAMASVRSSEFEFENIKRPRSTRFANVEQRNDFLAIVDDVIKEESNIHEQHNQSMTFIDRYRFNTFDLRPTSQKTKHGDVSILENGRVVISFKKEARTYTVSDDGDHITVQDQHIVNDYRLSDLPARHLLAYRYASKFVKLVRSKTIRIALDSATAKCRLYFNDTFEVVLAKQKLKVTFCPKSQTARVADHDAIRWRGAIETVALEYRDLLRQGLVWWGRCIDALDDETEPQHQARFLSGQGWCERRENGNQWAFFFLDGCSLVLSTDTRTVSLVKADGQHEQHLLERGLPESVRKILKTASKAMRDFV